MDVLEGIEALDWAQWHHAYGPATDVPSCLRALTDADLDAADEAKWQLYGNLWHQGTIYEATGHAVPWLIRLLDDPMVDHAWLLTYLGHIAMGSSYNAQHAGLDFINASTDEYQEQMAQELAWVKAARDRLVEGRPSFVRMLTHDDPAVRSSVLYVYACLGGALPIEDVRDLTTDASPMVRASAVLSLVDADDAVGRATAERAMMDISLAVRWAGAYLAAFLPNAGAPVVTILLDALNDSEALLEIMNGSPFVDDGVDSMSANALARIGPEIAPEAIDGMIGRLNWVGASEALSLVSTLLYMVFGNKPAPPTLTDAQRKVLRAIAASDNAWTFDGNMWGILNQWELPTKRADLKTHADDAGI
ncbi:MAG: hypothetical protein R3E66_01085 [bacterium]